MSAHDKYLSPQETHKLQRDLRQVLDQCNVMFSGITKQEQANVQKLRSAFLMMRDMGYSAEEAKEEFTRFQAQYNANTSTQPGSDNGVRVCVQRRKRTGTNTPGHRTSKKSGLTGAQRFGRVFTLCLVVIPILFVVGLVTEIWFYSNPWGRALLNVRHGKAVAYLITWYMMLSSCMPKLVTKGF